MTQPLNADSLVQTGKTGLFRLNSRDIPALKAATAELGHAFFSVDLQRAANVPGFIKALKRDLQFPDWFGGNLDALNDCLTDFSWHPAPGYVIVLSGIERLSANLTSFAALNEVLSGAVEEWQTRGVPFCIFYVANDLVSASTKP